MPAPSPLVVPVDLQALLVNARVRERNFQRWTLNYQALVNYDSPEPKPFDTDLAWATDPANDGVWLHWRLPAALRHGTHDAAASTTTFPLVPNRWVVVRYSGPLAARTATAWIVESDFLDPDTPASASSSWADPAAATMATRIGTALPLAGWSERGTAPLFLTAVAPGNLHFSMYQPYALNVFSLHDDLAGVADGEVLSYLVAGWYSDPAADILAGWNPASRSFADFAASLGWSVSGGESAEVSVYEGFVFGLEWSATADPATAPDLLHTPNTLAVGNTAIDALTALVGTQPDPPADPDLLQAFQYDLLRLLDRPDGAGLLAAAIERAWFGAYPGGYVWEIVAADGGPGEGDPPWLFALNRAQADYDAAARELAAQQWQLYVMWWKRGNAAGQPKKPKGYPEDYDAALDPAVQGSLVNQVYAAMQHLADLRAAIPWGDTPEELAASAARYAAAHQLPAAWQLRRGDLPPFAEANDPVIVVAGAGAPSIVDEPSPLPCRFADQLVTGFTYDGAPITTATMAGHIPAPELGAVPPVVASLVDELFFLDPNDAAMVAAVALGTTDPTVILQVQEVMQAHEANIGTLPALLPGAWAQPWSPLFLLWQVQFCPIPFETDGAANWDFDGTDFDWTGTGADPTGLFALSGRTFLTPSCSVNLENRIDDSLRNNPDADLAALEAFVATREGWDFLAQSLSGFNDQLQLRHTTSLRSPDATQVLYPPDVTMATLTAGAATAIPIAGPTTVPFGRWPPTHFQQLRAGQFYFEAVTVVDRFGQGVELVNPLTWREFAPVRVPEMLPGTGPALPEPEYTLVQTTPRLLQPARLDLDFVSATNDGAILDLDAGVNPICAWILPNHLDHALACYDPAGGALGEVYVVMNDGSELVVDWFPAPNSAYPSIASLEEDFPNLARFLAGVRDAGAAAFTALLRVIDETLATIDPLGAHDDQYLSALVGRPLVLVRTLLRLRLDGPPQTDPSWEHFDPVPPDFPTYRFGVRLGDAALRDDGTIGYFVDTDYGRFHAVFAPPEASDPYIAPIGPGSYLQLQLEGTSSAYLTILADPRSPVNAFTGILPVTSLAVPQSFIVAALSNLSVTFRVGPLLSGLQLPASGPAQVVMPQPAQKSGAWSWIQLDGGAPASYGITPADPTPQLPNTPPELRTGWLQLAPAAGTEK
ncbi:MAG TPA: hypothetical protein VEQ60_13080 [Longimicrobium sp.]|nr:hypothetical protein [Longimicrobium sp.]